MMFIYGTPGHESWCEPLLHTSAGRRSGKAAHGMALAAWQHSVIGNGWWLKSSEHSCSLRSPHAFK